MPLVKPDGTQFDSRAVKAFSKEELYEKGVLPEITGLYENTGNTALLLSHAHQDHYGLIQYVSAKAPIYLGKATEKLIKITDLFTHREGKERNYRYYRSGKSFEVGDIRITPYLMDHSAFDAYGFLVEANGKSIFYSGDFRTHGRKKKAFDWFSYNVKSNIDYLLLEGTTISRKPGKFPTEIDLEAKFVECFRQTDGINLVYTSGQNIDRLVTIFRACRKTNKTLAIDFYIANVLSELSEFGNLPFPSKTFPEIRVFFPYRLSAMISRKGQEKLLYRFKNYKITKDQIDDNSKQIVMIVRPSMQGDLERLNNLAGGTFIYSMWSGYKKEKQTNDFLKFLSNSGMSLTDIHTSGHADLEGLTKMVDALKPKNIIPIHTFEGGRYQEVFPEWNVLRIDDGQIISA